MNAKEFAKKIENIYSEELIAVIMYGSKATREEYSEKFSDINLIIILNELAPAKLCAVNKLIRKWVKEGNPIPLFFDLEHIRTSSDVFPIEFMDIHDRHQLLVGEKDPFKDIFINFGNLRHQCESELKGTILHLRSFYAANCNKPKLVAKATLSAWSNVRPVFRGVLKLLGEPTPSNPKALVETLAAKIDFNPQIFFDIIAIRENSKYLPRKDEALDFAEQFLTEVSLVASFVDKFKTEE